MIIEHGSKQYHVRDRVYQNSEYRLYICSQSESGFENLLQIATDTGHNGDLDRSVYFLNSLLYLAEEVEEEYAKVKINPKEMLNYHLGFPEVVDTFVSAKQGERRVNILGFRNVSDVRTMVPLYNIVHKDNRRVDLKTSIWIMGKLLKILTFIHGADISIGNVSLENILIEPDKHYVVVFNWAKAQKCSDVLSRQVVEEEIQHAAICVLKVLGGMGADDIPDDGSQQYLPYISHLHALACAGNRSAEAAHREFYEFVDSLWPRGFQPFTTLPR